MDKPGCSLFRLEIIGATAGPGGHENVQTEVQDALGRPLHELF
jgi:hypothetical protein